MYSLFRDDLVQYFWHLFQLKVNEHIFMGFRTNLNTCELVIIPITLSLLPVELLKGTLKLD